MDADDLVARLLTLAGEILEDVSPATIIRGTNAEERFVIVQQAGADIVQLAQAAEIVYRRK